MSARSSNRSIRRMTLPSTELIYFPDCPHVNEARARLNRAFREADLVPSWVEYQTNDPSLPEHARGFGSPTILVDGQDVAGTPADGCADACRLYRDEAGTLRGAPSLQTILAALKAAGERS